MVAGGRQRVAPLGGELRPRSRNLSWQYSTATACQPARPHAPGTVCGAARGLGCLRSGCRQGAPRARHMPHSRARGPAPAERWQDSWCQHPPAATKCVGEMAGVGFELPRPPATAQVAAIRRPVRPLLAPAAAVPSCCPCAQPPHCTCSTCSKHASHSIDSATHTSVLWGSHSAQPTPAQYSCRRAMASWKVGALAVARGPPLLAGAAGVGPGSTAAACGRALEMPRARFRGVAPPSWLPGDKFFNALEPLIARWRGAGVPARHRSLRAACMLLTWPLLHCIRLSAGQHSLGSAMIAAAGAMRGPKDSKPSDDHPAWQRPGGAASDGVLEAKHGPGGGALHRLDDVCWYCNHIDAAW